jgi:hypothetical protein
MCRTRLEPVVRHERFITSVRPFRLLCLCRLILARIAATCRTMRAFQSLAAIAAMLTTTLAQEGEQMMATTGHNEAAARNALAQEKTCVRQTFALNPQWTMPS